MSISQIKSISYLKSHAAQIAQELADGADPLVVTQNGVARLVVMNAADYERREQTLALLKLLALGDREIEGGQHIDADEVYAELDAE
jgi:prevent-host-death family protein